MKKTVIVIFNNNDPALNAGSHVAVRMAQVAKENNVELEVYLFGPAQKAFSNSDNTGAKADFKENIKELIASGIKVGACKNSADSDGLTESLLEKGIHLEFARDAFLRYGAEHAAVLNF